MTLCIDMKKEGVSQLNRCADILVNGGTVVFPTETVYGLGASALDDKAVEKIYLAKGRPSDNPLIVHIADKTMLASLVLNVDERAKKLMAKFWPGPLTLIFKKSHLVPDAVTAGLDTVAIRMPSHATAKKLLSLANIPIAAPSANISGRPSPTRASHVLKDLKGRVDAIITDGDVTYGLESTVLDISGDLPMLLRPGTVTKKQIETCIGSILVDKTLLKQIDLVTPKAPGMKYKHYSPDAEVYVLNAESDDVHKEKVMRSLKARYQRIKYIEDSAEALSKTLYAKLIEADELGFDVILIKAVNPEGVGLAVMNRLLKAANYKVL